MGLNYPIRCIRIYIVVVTQTDNGTIDCSVVVLNTKPQLPVLEVSLWLCCAFCVSGLFLCLC